jgi:hypothetical protein
MCGDDENTDDKPAGIGSTIMAIMPQMRSQLITGARLLKSEITFSILTRSLSPQDNGIKVRSNSWFPYFLSSLQSRS